MINNFFDAIYLNNYSNDAGCHQWNNLPDDLWQRLVSNLQILKIDGIGFQNITSTDDLPVQLANKLKTFAKHTGRYQPYHADSTPEIAVFELTDEVQYFLLSQHFDQWNRANELLPFDEVCFFRGNTIAIQAVAYENLLLFYSLSREDVRKLGLIDARFRSGLYYNDLSGRVSFK